MTEVVQLSCRTVRFCRQVVERDPTASSKLSRYSSSTGDGMSLQKSIEGSSCNSKRYWVSLLFDV